LKIVRDGNVERATATEISVRLADFYRSDGGIVVTVVDELSCGGEVTDWPKTGFLRRRMPARRKNKVRRRRMMWDADMAGSLNCSKCAVRDALQPVVCVIEVM
jgi:hypothetical protein